MAPKTLGFLTETQENDSIYTKFSSSPGKSFEMKRFLYTTQREPKSFGFLCGLGENIKKEK